MPNPLIRKLDNFTHLSDEEKHAICVISSEQTRIGARQDIIREGEVLDKVHLVLDGFGCRYKLLPDGRRQIIAHFIPGDFCNLRAFILAEMDHHIGTLSAVTLATISRRKLIELTDDYPRITQGLWWSAMVDEAITREWIVNVGSRTAEERVAHLMCEHFLRMRAVGRAEGNSVEMPITQMELGDTLGLSTVHVNRTIQHLRAEGLIALREKTLTILDLPRLQAIGVFNPNYLHFLHTRSGTTSADIERERVANGSPASVINRHANQPELRSGPPY
jgi:CRP-like cAMP-binding protein